MHSSKPLWKCGPRKSSPGAGTGISTSRRVTACEPFAPETISSDFRPGRPSRVACAWLNTRAISPLLSDADSGFRVADDIGEPHGLRVARDRDERAINGRERDVS